MYCPKCSQQQVSEEVRFCSRCGFLLTGVAELIKNDGEFPAVMEQNKTSRLTPRRKGFKHGLFALLLLILTSPVILIIGKELEIHPAPLFLTFFILFISCVIRMIYALMFESNEPFDLQTQNAFAEQKTAGSLPPPQTDFVSPTHGKWRDSNELVFSSVTDATTNQLDKK